METAYVKSNTGNKITTIEFFHPKSNSLPSTLLNELVVQINNAGLNKESKIIVLKSKGERVFCAGASFDELLAINNLEKGTQFFMGFANVVNAIRKCPKIVIGEINGKVVGGGVGITAACDYSIAHQESLFKLSELAIGIGPFVIEPAIKRKIGIASMSAMTLNPTEWKRATYIHKINLVTEIKPTQEEVSKAVLNKAIELAAYSNEALKNLKSIFWEDTQDWDTILPKRAALSGKLVLSDFTKKTLQKFKNK